jgi:hypothetical protein
MLSRRLVRPYIRGLSMRVTIGYKKYVISSLAMRKYTIKKQRVAVYDVGVPINLILYQMKLA